LINVHQDRLESLLGHTRNGLKTGKGAFFFPSFDNSEGRGLAKMFFSTCGSLPCRAQADSVLTIQLCLRPTHGSFRGLDLRFRSFTASRRGCGPPEAWPRQGSGWNSAWSVDLSEGISIPVAEVGMAVSPWAGAGSDRSQFPLAGSLASTLFRLQKYSPGYFGHRCTAAEV
jgi:hypothetical protein